MFWVCSGSFPGPIDIKNSYIRPPVVCSECVDTTHVRGWPYGSAESLRDRRVVQNKLLNKCFSGAVSGVFGSVSGAY